MMKITNINYLSLGILKMRLMVFNIDDYCSAEQIRAHHVKTQIVLCINSVPDEFRWNGAVVFSSARMSE